MGSLALNPGWPPDHISWAAEGRDGRLYSNRFPGVVAAATTAYLVPVATGVVPNSAAVSHPFELPVWPATAMAVAIASAAVFCTFVFLRGSGFSVRIAAISTAVVAFGSPVWSVSADALWTHGLTHLSIMCALIGLRSERPLLAGASFGVAALTRPHLIVVPLVLACFRLERWQRVAGVIGGMVGLGFSALYSSILFGRVIPSGGYNVEQLTGGAPIRSLSGLATNIWDWISDPLHGIAIFVPLGLLAVVGVPLVWRRVDLLTRTAAAAGLGYAASQLGLIRASGGDIVFGHRTTIEMFVLCLPLIVVSLWELSRRSAIGRVVVGAAMAYSVAIHGYVAWIDSHPSVSNALAVTYDRAMAEHRQ